MNDTLSTIPKVSKAPILTGERGLQFSNMDEIWRFCTAVVNSGTFKDINTPEVALIRLQAGLELGLTPIWALTNIFVVNGKPSVYGDAMLGIVLRQPDCEDVIETMEDSETAVCEVHRKGRLPIIRKFSVSDAKKSGLFGKSGPWSQYPQRMLAMRARSWACRDAFADALRGLGVVEEARDITSTVKQIERPKLVLPDEPETLPVVPVLADIVEETIGDDKPSR